MGNRRARLRRAHWMLLVVLTARASALEAQFQSFDGPLDRADRVSKVVLGNVAIGGGTAAIRALLAGRNVPKAFVAGAVGGAVHVSGKMISVGGGTASPIGGLLVSSVGASMVSNAGKGIGAFDEMFVPVSFVRLRVAPRAASPVRVSVALADVVLLVDAMHYSELAVDWKRTARAGTFVFTTPSEIISGNGESAGGVALGNVIVMTTSSSDTVETLRHEYLHVQQYIASQEIWGRPIDAFVRRRVKLLRFVPAWLELGMGDLLVVWCDYQLARRRGPWRRSMESEAAALTR